MRWLARILSIAIVATGCGDSSSGDEPDGSIAEGCEEPSGDGTEHQGLIDADETWTEADSPHRVVSDTDVKGATLTIEPCAVVQLVKGTIITVGSGDEEAALVAHGDTTARPVRFERAAAGDPWGALVVYATGTLDLEHVVLEGGGDPDTAPQLGGTLIAQGPGGDMGLTRNLHTVDVTVTDSGGYGVNVQDRAAFTADSDQLTVTGSAGAPVYIRTSALSTIPDGTYTGNAVDELTVDAVGSLLDDVTFHARGVPYHLLSSFSMAPPTTLQDGGLSTLTIEAGVTIRFDRDEANNWSMVLGTSSGTGPDEINPTRLIAQGTEDEPILITSNEDDPAPGDWGGINWRGAPADGNLMEWVTIRYAGADSGSAGFGCGPSDNDSALIIANWQPEDVFIQHSTFSDSAGGGIVSGWITDAGGPDLTGDNTFSGIGNGCDVSRWQDLDGCPADPPLCL